MTVIIENKHRNGGVFVNFANEKKENKAGKICVGNDTVDALNFFDHFAVLNKVDHVEFVAGQKRMFWLKMKLKTGFNEA